MPISWKGKGSQEREDIKLKTVIAEFIRVIVLVGEKDHEKLRCELLQTWDKTDILPLLGKGSKDINHQIFKKWLLYFKICYIISVFIEPLFDLVFYLTDD